MKNAIATVILMAAMAAPMMSVPVKASHFGGIGGGKQCNPFNNECN